MVLSRSSGFSTLRNFPNTRKNLQRFGVSAFCVWLGDTWPHLGPNMSAMAESDSDSADTSPPGAKRQKLGEENGRGFHSFDRSAPSCKVFETYYKVRIDRGIFRYMSFLNAIEGLKRLTFRLKFYFALCRPCCPSPRWKP